MENKREDNSLDPAYIVARILAKVVNYDDLSTYNQRMYDYWWGIRFDQPNGKFGREVDALVAKMKGDGKAVPLFSSDDLENANEHKKPIKTKGLQAYPEPFWPYVEPGTKPVDLELSKYPEKKMTNLGQELDNPHNNHPKSTLRIEAQHKRNELRKEIGLPIARGKDPHVNDDFYKYLVRRIYFRDSFNIFRDYDRAVDQIPEELNLKIQKVTALIDELLNGNLNRKERYARFKEFVEENEFE